MRNKTRRIMSLLLAMIMIFGTLPVINAAAKTIGDLTYTVEDGEVTITGCDEDTSGELVIPSKINGYPVTKIGDEAFIFCSDLTSITIPDSVTEIGEYAFFDCNNLKNIVIPDSGIAISQDAFNNTAYYNNSSNWDNNILYIGNYLITVRSSVTNSCTIKEGTKYIAERAFFKCEKLTNIAIPGSVISIGMNAFSNCYNLKTVTISNGVKFIDGSAFYYCKSLSTVKIPNSVTYLGRQAFYGCSSLANIELGDNIDYVNSNTFADTAYYNDSSNWENGALYIGKYLVAVNKNDVSGTCVLKPETKYIANVASLNSDKLTGIEISADNTNYSTENGVLFNKDKSTLLLYPIGKTDTEYVIPDSVTSIAESAFKDCKNLAKITIPDSVTNIGDYAFSDCTNLTSITIPNGVTEIGNSAFYYCENLASITIPNGVTEIGNSAFYYCENLASITIPDGVTEIGDRAFSHCKNLTSITIPNGVTKIGDGVFSHCENLASITIPNGVTEIGDDAFSYCKNLTSITIPDGVTEIGDRAFYDCTNLTSITIPNGVTEIGDGAFSCCENLASITIPNSVTRIGADAFAITAYYNDWSNWETLDEIYEIVALYIGNYLVGINKNYLPEEYEIKPGTICFADSLFNQCSELKAIIIPNSVKSIGEYAFNQCSNLTSVEIPDSVEYIGEYAFCACSSLKNVKLSKNISEIKSHTFADCVFESIEIPNSAKVIGTRAFSDCPNLVNIEIPDGVMYIEFETFWNCPNLQKVSVSKSVKYIEELTFEFCTSLTSIDVAEDNQFYSSIDGVLYNKNKTTLVKYPEGKTDKEYVIPETVKKIDSLSFDNCSIERVTLPDNLMSIGECAFGGDRKLSYINIPDSVKVIYDYAFYCCDSLKSISLPKGVEINEIAFGYSDNTEVTDDNERVKDFTIYGYTGSTAEAYATENEFRFVAYKEHVHSYTPQVTKTATCTEDGIITYTCDCGDSYTETIPAIGHEDSDKDGKCDHCGNATLECDESCNCICHKKTIFGKIVRYVYTLISIVSHKRISCCPGMEYLVDINKYV